LSVEERGLVGLEVRTVDGTEVGRIVEVITDEESGEVTHVVVEREEERFEVPISEITLEASADFATFHADRPDEESEDSEHEGQLAADPESPGEAQEEEDLEAREDWEDETYTADSGYPRNDVYVDPETGEEVTDPLIEENEGLDDDVEDLLVDTELKVRSVEDGVVELTGAARTREDLDALVEEITGLDGVLEVDTTDVDVG
jgi:sporulation protein YlmC with PRC-barrel domain